MNKVVVLAGGIGNQLFQLAAGFNKFDSFSVYLDNLNRYKSKRKSIVGVLTPNIKRYKGSFIFKLLLKSKITYKLSIPFIFNDINYFFGEIFMSGYFQNYKKNISGIKKISRIVENHTRTVQKKLENKIIFEQEYSIAIHIRLGDYLNESDFWIFDKEYLSKSLREFSQVKKIYIFCPNSLPLQILSVLNKLSVEIFFIKDLGLSDDEEFILLSCFKNLIISNSTFSYWAGIINHNKIPKKIIAPNMFYKNKNKNISWINNCIEAKFKVL